MSRHGEEIMGAIDSAYQGIAPDLGECDEDDAIDTVLGSGAVEDELSAAARAEWCGMSSDGRAEMVRVVVQGRSAPKETSMPRYPSITVELSGRDGNAFFILGTVMRALRRAGVSESDIQAFQKEATAGDYDHLLQTCMRWVEVE